MLFLLHALVPYLGVRLSCKLFQPLRAPYTLSPWPLSQIPFLNLMQGQDPHSDVTHTGIIKHIQLLHCFQQLLAEGWTLLLARRDVMILDVFAGIRDHLEGFQSTSFQTIQNPFFSLAFGLHWFTEERVQTIQWPVASLWDLPCMF